MKFGTQDINKVYFGNTEIEKCYFGSSLVYQKTSPVATAGHTLGLYHFENSFNDVFTGNPVTVNTRGSGSYEDLTSQGYSFVSGKFGQAFNRARGGSAGTLACHNNVYRDNFTIDYWIKSNYGLGYGPVGCFESFPAYWVSANPLLGISFYGTSDASLFIPSTGVVTISYSTFSPYVSQNDFNHVALQKKDTKIQLYVNGHLVINEDCPQALPGQYIDFSYQGNSDGYYDEIRFSDIARYNGDFTPETQPYGDNDFIPSPDWNTYWSIPDTTPDSQGEGVYGPFERYKWLSPKTQMSSGQYYDLVLCIRPPASQTSNQALMGISTRTTSLGLTSFRPYFFDGALAPSGIVSDNSLLPNVWYYVRVIYCEKNGTPTSTMYTIRKGDYSKENLPPLSQWREEVSIAADVLQIANTDFNQYLTFGGSQVFAEYFKGWMDFNNSYLREYVEPTPTPSAKVYDANTKVYLSFDDSPIINEATQQEYEIWYDYGTGVDQIISAGNSAYPIITPSDRTNFGSCALLQNGNIFTGLSINTLNGVFTIEGWIKLYNPQNATVDQSNQAMVGRGLALYHNYSGGGTPVIYCPQFEFSAYLQDNAWYHVAITCDGTTLSIYVSGNLITTTSYFIDPNANTLPFIGSISYTDYSGTGNFGLMIDDIRISDCVRYTGSSFTKPTEPFTAL